jgi:hypothetical protein
VLLHGQPTPPGALRFAGTLYVPVAWIPVAEATALLAAQRAGLDVGVAIGRGRTAPNADLGFVAGFSSRGLAFDGRVKPDVAAPGVGLATAEPGGPTLYGTLNGTSAAAATVPGATELSEEIRRASDGWQLRSLLVGYAQPGGAAARGSARARFARAHPPSAR